MKNNESTATNTVTENKSAFEEKKWLMWLLKVWDDNDQKPTWVTIKRNWPEEYQRILMAIGPWDIVDKRLEDVQKTRQQIIEECELTEMQAIHAASVNIICLEKHILGLIKLQEYLKIDRLPTFAEIIKYSAKLGIPSSSSYSRALVSKENWKPCIQGYLACTPDNRMEFLYKTEVKLRKQRKVKKNIHSELLPHQQYTEKQCLDAICEVYDHFGKIPTQSKISAYLRQRDDLPSFTTLTKRLGCVSSWIPLLTDYRTEREIERYLANCGSLKVEGPKNLDSLLRKLDKVASVNDKLEIETALKEIRKSTNKEPTQFEVEIAGQEYEVVIRKKR